MAKAKKRVAKPKKSSKRRKASDKLKYSLDHDRIVALAARVDQMLWVANANRQKVMS